MDAPFGATLNKPQVLRLRSPLALFAQDDKSKESLMMTGLWWGS